MYALYKSFGYSHAEIGQLFVAGFGASFVSGIFVGGFADSFGRKQSVLVYCGLYILSCMTKHVNDYKILMLGRITGGIATSILFSVFETWLVYEHTARHSFPAGLLSYTFSLMYASNFLVATASGMGSQMLVETMPIRKFGNLYFGGSLLAFDAAILVLCIAGCYVALKWDENYGERVTGIKESLNSVAAGVRMVGRNRQLIMCAMVVSLFEGSMYIFVFSWTPVVTKGGDDPPLGIIFSAFMIACMCGASLYNRFSHIGADKVLLVTLFMAAVATSIPVGIGITPENAHYNFLALTMFELCVGAYFPAIGTVKSKIVEEPHRATLYNVFRMPMNAIVLVVLLTNPPLTLTFQMLSGMLFAGMVFLGMLVTDLKELPENKPMLRERSAGPARSAKSQV